MASNENPGPDEKPKPIGKPLSALYLRAQKKLFALAGVITGVILTVIIEPRVEDLLSLFDDQLEIAVIGPVGSTDLGAAAKSFFDGVDAAESDGEISKTININYRVERYDDGGDPDNYLRIIDQLVGRSDVIAIIPATSSTFVKRSINRLVDSDKLVLLPVSSQPDLLDDVRVQNDNTRNIFRLISRDDSQIASIYDYVLSSKQAICSGMKRSLNGAIPCEGGRIRLGIIREPYNRDYFSFIANSLRKKFETCKHEFPEPEICPEVVMDGEVDSSNTLYLEYQYTPIDVLVYVGQQPNAQVLLRQARYVDPNIDVHVILTESSIAGNPLQPLGLVPGSVGFFPTNFSDKQPINSDWKLLGQKQRLNYPSYYTFGYDSIALIAEALKQIGRGKPISFDGENRLLEIFRSKELMVMQKTDTSEGGQVETRVYRFSRDSGENCHARYYRWPVEGGTNDLLHWGNPQPATIEVSATSSTTPSGCLGSG